MNEMNKEMRREPASLRLPLIAVLLCLIIGTADMNAMGRKRPHTPAYNDYLNVLDYGISNDGKADVADTLQRLLDAHPNRTIFFPDGTYLLSHPLLTSSDPTRSVCLVLSNYAVIKAAANWQAGEAVIRLGALHKKNNITINGSNYGLYGGIIDGSGVANGVSIDGGRETKVQDVSIKNTQIGLHIKYGANSGSADADISDVNIVGNNHSDAVGVLIEGYDNTLTNMRIASVHYGVWIKSGGNSLRNIHPLYISKGQQVYEGSCGFLIEQSNNWCYYCYSDQMSTGFLLKNGASANLTDCFCYWYSGKVPYQTAIESEGKFNSICSGLKVGFRDDCPERTVLKAEKGGQGMLVNMIRVQKQNAADDVSDAYYK